MMYTDEFFIGSITALTDDLEYSEIKVVTDQHDDKDAVIEPMPIIFFFNKKTKVRGCKFNQLCLGDKVKVNKIVVTKRDKKNIVFCNEIEILDIQAKWNKILRNDKKYSISHSMENNLIIRPEIIKPQLEKCSDSDKVKLEEIIANGNLPKREKKILQLFIEGKTYRVISEVVSYSHVHCIRIVKKYLDGK